jgi:eukaryotic-like serine/threonine-protein kinase
MNPATQREESVFYAALNLSDPDGRRAFLDRECADDAALRAAVEELLSTHADTEQFFAAGRSALKLDARQAAAFAPAAEVVPLHPDTRIDRYRLVEAIGEGGCGVVYLAEQQEPVRRLVALKIIKLGMDTRNVIARFEAERQALALMDHPNIARVLDAGATVTGRPFFVMELVRGVRITNFCDENHLDTDQRLDLFIQICHAVQHAHQKGIIHRDIKPSNILVTLHDGEPVPKVIDFGIAKATEAPLTDKTLFTSHEHIIGTPAYMSPEQAEMSGLDIDTRSDIYSLGVLLYELLTGRPPFDPKKLAQSGVDEMRRTLREQEPQRPSIMVTTLHGTELWRTAEFRHSEPPKLISSLRGDLDWVVLKALEKDRARRYQTANALAMDIQRYLGNEPVLARPPSRLYRFQKLVRRNKGVFAAVTAVALTLLVSLAALTWLFLQERAERKRAVAAEREQAVLSREAETREKITRAALRLNEEQFDEADEIATAIPFSKPTIEGADVLRRLGRRHAEQGNWKLSAERLDTLVKVNQFDSWTVSSTDYLEAGPVIIELKDPNRYDQFRQDVLARYAGATNPIVAERAVKISLLAPASPQGLAALRPLADTAAQSLAPAETLAHPDPNMEAWRELSLALMEYRSGNCARSVEWCGNCLASSDRNISREATVRVIMAMSLRKLDGASDGRAEWRQARAVIEDKFREPLDDGNGTDGFWFDWLFARILLREADPMFQGNLEARS